MVESLLKSGFQLPPAPARAALVLRFINSFTIADGACEARSRSDEEGDALSSPTNRDDEIARNHHRPEGLRRNGPVFFAASLSQGRSIAPSSLLESGAIAVATIVELFMRRNT